MRAASLWLALLLAGGCGDSGGDSFPDTAVPAPFDAAGPEPDAALPVFADAAVPADVRPDAAAADAAADTIAVVPADAAPDAGIDIPPPMPVTVQFAGTVVTVARMPLGLDGTARTAPITGTFTYDLRTLDARPADLMRGRFEHGTTSGFTFTVLGHTIEGSGYAVVETENLASSDTVRFRDGPGLDTIPRIMKLDGTAAPTLKLLIAISDGTAAMLMNDALPSRFPVIDIAGTPHTFSLEDAGGTLLMQLTSLTMK